jgi:glycosyltransferase involved in cell wall biosynthesis
VNITVIVTTYNRPDALAATLDGFLAQDILDFELAVADDGSTAETRLLTESYARKAPFAVRHVWQEDRGFRAGAIRNRAIALTKAEYVIFSDGDCVPAPAFVRRHRELAEPGYFLSANRILLSERLTSEVLQMRLPVHAWGAADWFRVWLKRDVNRVMPLLQLPDTAFRKRSPLRWKGVKTCNLSVWRTDLLRVNGFDESYSGWGLEDSDLVIRLLHAGVKHKSARFAAPVFHLWHPEQDRSRFPENQHRLDEILGSQRIEALVGINRCRST